MGGVDAQAQNNQDWPDPFPGLRRPRSAGARRTHLPDQVRLVSHKNYHREKTTKPYEFVKTRAPPLKPPRLGHTHKAPAPRTSPLTGYFSHTFCAHPLFLPRCRSKSKSQRERKEKESLNLKQEKKKKKTIK